jgi:N-acetylated-alpha-linked acidic dipeptidase
MPGRARLLDSITMVQSKLCYDAWQIIDYLLLTVDTKVVPIWNTMGVIPGYITNEVVVVGNHRDGKHLFDFYIVPIIN